MMWFSIAPVLWHAAMRCNVCLQWMHAHTWAGLEHSDRETQFQRSRVCMSVCVRIRVHVRAIRSGFSFIPVILVVIPRMTLNSYVFPCPCTWLKRGSTRCLYEDRGVVTVRTAVTLGDTATLLMNKRIA